MKLGQVSLSTACKYFTESFTGAEVPQSEMIRRVMDLLKIAEDNNKDLNINFMISGVKIGILERAETRTVQASDGVMISGRTTAELTRNNILSNLSSEWRPCTEVKKICRDAGFREVPFYNAIQVLKKTGKIVCRSASNSKHHLAIELKLA